METSAITARASAAPLPEKDLQQAMDTEDE